MVFRSSLTLLDLILGQELQTFMRDTGFREALLTYIDILETGNLIATGCATSVASRFELSGE